MPTAAEEGIALMEKMVQDGTAKDRGEAYVKLCKQHPQLLARYREEERQRQPVTKQGVPPLDYATRQALRKQEFPLTTPPARSPLDTWEVMVANMLAKHPGMSYDAAGRAVMTQDGGAYAYERYRQQQLFGRRG